MNEKLGSASVISTSQYLEDSKCSGSTVVLADQCRKIFSAEEGYVISLWQWIGCLGYKGEHDYNRDRLNGNQSLS
jgi:hypothetical protein